MVGQILKYEFIRDIFSTNCGNNFDHNVIFQRLVAPCCADHCLHFCAGNYLEVDGGIELDPIKSDAYAIGLLLADLYGHLDSTDLFGLEFIEKSRKQLDLFAELYDVKLPHMER